MNLKQKLELTWIGKNSYQRIEPRILMEDPDKSFHAEKKVTEYDLFDNRLIFGDNLLALRALESEFVGKIKCIYIDPPFNTGVMYEHYEDGLEHSIWLTLMMDRLRILHNLLANDGYIFVQIDYREGARLKILLDEIFGENCFKNEIIVRRGTKNVQSQFETIDALSTGHDSIFLYSKSPASRLPKLQALADDEEPGKWDTFWRGTDRPTMRYELFGITPEKGQWRWKESRSLKAKRNYEKYLESYEDEMTIDEFYSLSLLERGEDLDFIRLGPEGQVQYFVPPRNYKILSDVWMDVKTSGKYTDFSHEKHEELLERIIRWTTKDNEWVLDSFAGSGTTGAVAHKLRRQWIMVEQGEHCHTHIIPRLKSVIDGSDLDGISKQAEWTGGGGFRYYKIAPSLLEKDKWGNWVISPKYNAEMLAEAMCKLLGFTYSPNQICNLIQLHGFSSERDFIYVTTASLTHKQLTAISDALGENRTLLICCKAFNADAEAFPNLTLVKIPKAVLDKCEWGKDDYSLNVANLETTITESNEDGCVQLSVLTGNRSN